MKQPGQPWLLSSPSLTIPGDSLAGRACQWFKLFLVSLLGCWLEPEQFVFLFKGNCFILHIWSLPKLVAPMINLTRFDCVNLSKLWIKMTPLQHLPCKSTILWSALESLINGCACFLALSSSKSVSNPMHQGVQKYILAIAFQMELTSCQWVWYASALQPVADPSSATR
jgi:hypothetical protein